MADFRNSEKSKKDSWDKADIIGKLAVAVLVALVGWWIQGVVTTQNTGKDYIGIALGILENKDQTEAMKKNTALRQWAVDLLKYYSSITLDKFTGDKLVSGEVDIYGKIDSSAFSGQDKIFPNVVVGIKDPQGADIIVLVNVDGVIRVSPFKIKQFPAYLYDTGLKSPIGIDFSDDVTKLLVYNSQSLELFAFDTKTPEGVPHLNTPLKITPPSSILHVYLSYHGTPIMVWGADQKARGYDFDGNEKSVTDVTDMIDQK